jgi:hypothetical protein
MLHSLTIDTDRQVKRLEGIEKEDGGSGNNM